MNPPPVSADVSDLLFQLWSIFGTVAVVALVALFLICALVYAAYKLIASLGWRLFVNGAPHFVRFTQWREEQKMKRP